jgi:hypothetical protein
MGLDYFNPVDASPSLESRLVKGGAAEALGDPCHVHPIWFA